MNRDEILSIAIEYVSAFKEVLMIDPFWNIKVEIAEGDFVNECSPEQTSPLSWIIRLNPSRHLEESDIKYSVLESLIGILFEPLEGTFNDKNGLIARISTVICNILSVEESEEQNLDE